MDFRVQGRGSLSKSLTGIGTPVKPIAFKLTKKLKWGSTLVKIPQNMFVHCTFFKVSWRRWRRREHDLVVSALSWTFINWFLSIFGYNKLSIVFEYIAELAFVPPLTVFVDGDKGALCPRFQVGCIVFPCTTLLQR